MGITRNLGHAESVRAVTLPLVRSPALAVDQFAVGDEGPDRLLDVFLEGDLSAADLAQRGDSRLVVALDQAWGACRQMTGPFRRQDHQREVVSHALETIFDRNSCHVPCSVLSASTRERGMVGLPLAPRRRSRHDVMNAPGGLTVASKRRNVMLNVAT